MFFLYPKSTSKSNLKCLGQLYQKLQALEVTTMGITVGKVFWQSFSNENCSCTKHITKSLDMENQTYVLLEFDHANNFEFLIL